MDVGVRMIITDWLMGMEQDLACYQKHPDSYERGLLINLKAFIISKTYPSITNISLSNMSFIC